MAINVQIKGDRKFEDAVATNDYRNGTTVNNAYTQPWIAGLDAFNMNPMYTTPTLDGMTAQAFYASQVPSSFASLYGNRTFQATSPFMTADSSQGMIDSMSAAWATAAQQALQFASIATRWSTAARQTSQYASMMPVDIYETGDEFILLTDIPGASIEDINIFVEEGMLIIKGMVKPISWEQFGMDENAVALLQEKPAIRSFHRTFPISANVLVDKLTARLSDGVLTITLPKVKANCTSTRRVAVATA